MTTQIVMDHTGDSPNPERSFAERADGISDRQGFRSHSRPPLPDLSWRNVRRVFPQYGWEAGFPNGAFPADRRLKLCSAPLRLSDKTSRIHPRHVAPKPAQAYEPEVPARQRRTLASFKRAITRCPVVAVPEALAPGSRPRQLLQRQI
jgi:hypothetical protein